MASLSEFMLFRNFQLLVEMLLIQSDRFLYFDSGISLSNFLGGPSWSLISDIKRNQLSVSGENKKRRRNEGREGVAYLLDHPPCFACSNGSHRALYCVQGRTVSSGGG